MSRRTTNATLERATRVMFTRIMTGLARTLRDEELTISQVAALHLIDEGGAHRVAVLGDLLGLSPSAASRMTDALVQRDLLDRSEDPGDRRARVLQLTAKGRALVDGMGADRVATI